MAKKGGFQSPFQVHFEAANPASQTVFSYTTKKRHQVFWQYGRLLGVSENYVFFQTEKDP